MRGPCHGLHVCPVATLVAGIVLVVRRREAFPGGAAIAAGVFFTACRKTNVCGRLTTVFLVCADAKKPALGGPSSSVDHGLILQTCGAMQQNQAGQGQAGQWKLVPVR